MKNEERMIFLNEVDKVDGLYARDKTMEYKLKLGYSFGKNLVYGFYGSGDLNVYWSDYTNEKTSTHDYEIKGIGLSRKITNITFNKCIIIIIFNIP